MIITSTSYDILTPISNPMIVDKKVELAPGITQTDYKDARGWNELKHLERIARVCYRSEGQITEDSLESAKELIGKLIKRGHEAMLEHGSFSVIFTVDRALSHELVRHRMASFAQESQRYCNYSKDQFGNQVTFVKPFWLRKGDAGFDDWKLACQKAESTYFDLLDDGYSPQMARSVLPNCTATHLVITANYREWRHIFKLRCAESAHPDMRHLMIQLCNEMKARLPVIFDDIECPEVFG